MAWGRVCGNLSFHRKTLAAGNEAMGVWVRMLSWTCDNGTDGFVPSAVVQLIAGRQEPIDALVAARWLEAAPDGTGMVLRNHLKWNPSKAESDAMAERRSAAGKRGNEVRWATDASQLRSQTDRTVIANSIAKASPTPTPTPTPTPISGSPSENLSSPAAPAPSEAPTAKAKKQRTLHPDLLDLIALHRSLGGTVANERDRGLGVNFAKTKHLGLETLRAIVTRAATDRLAGFGAAGELAWVLAHPDRFAAAPVASLSMTDDEKAVWDHFVTRKRARGIQEQPATPTNTEISLIRRALADGHKPEALQRAVESMLFNDFNIGRKPGYPELRITLEDAIGSDSKLRQHLDNWRPRP